MNNCLRPWLSAVALMLVLVTRPCLAGDDFERWYIMELGKSRAGWTMQSQSTAGDLITSVSRTEINLARGKTEAGLSMDSSFVETKAGKAVSLKTSSKFGKTPTVMTATFGETAIDVVVSVAGRTDKSTRPLPEGTWLTPAAANDFVRQRLSANADKIVVRTFEGASPGLDPMAALKVVTIERTAFEPVEYEFEGKKIKAYKCIAVSSSQPQVKSVEILDEAGVPLSTEAALGGIAISVKAASKAEANIRAEGPELMVSTFVKPDRPIPNPRDVTKAVYLLSVPDGQIPTLPTTGSQSIEAVGDKSVRLTIGKAPPTAAPVAETTDSALTACPTTLNCSDPEIKKLAATATASAGADKAERAEAIRQFVYKHISGKDLAVGFATASEVARTKQGDCTEHGVLTAAVLRADGIPSRVVAGLVYADHFANEADIFAYHMWTQALLEVNGKPTWVDLDATLPNKRPFDATHIALAVSALGENDTQESLLTTLATVLGRLKISVEKVE
jgi:transglutaminase-like putative cysteine protease